MVNLLEHSVTTDSPHGMHAIGSPLIQHFAVVLGRNKGSLLQAVKVRMGRMENSGVTGREEASSMVPR